MNRSRKKIIDQEIGTVFKKWHQKLSVVIVFPNTYAVGMSNLGFQTIYHLLNQLDHVVCERAFVDKNTQRHECISMESGRPLADFNIIAFSLFIENDYINIIHALTLSEISARSQDRFHDSPLVLAGGVVTFLNPEPVAPFIDVFYIGEAEHVFPQLLKNIAPSNSKDEILNQIESFPGVYIPNHHQKVRRQLAPDITSFNTHSTLMTPNTTFTNTFLIEVSRGCSHGCRYCGAGYVYRPPRFRTYEQLSETIDSAKISSNKVALLGAAVSDLPFLNTLCEQVYQKGMTMALSSFRADAMSDQWLSFAVNAGIKTMTIAPDAGSERLRRVVNKGMCESDFLSCVEKLIRAGIMNIRVYLMIGLPTETWDDIILAVKFCKKMQEIFINTSRHNKKIGQLTLNVNCFIPKASTPFQWTGLETIASLKKKVKYFKKHLQKLPNIHLQVDSPRKANIQALLSRGDQKMSDLIERAYQLKGNWAQAMKTFNFNQWTAPKRTDDPLPWDFIDQGIQKDFLAQEYQKALNGQTSLECFAECRRCGVC